MNKFLFNAAAADGGGDPTAMVLKAIGEMKAGQANLATKADIEPIAVKAANDAIEPIKTEIAALSTQVQKLDEKAGMFAVPAEKTSIVKEIQEGIKANIDGLKLKQVKFGDPTTTHHLLKTVGVMTVADDLLAGSAVSTYDLRLNALPGRLVNFRNLAAVIPSGTGIFQFPRERAKEGSIATQTPGLKKSVINARFEMVTVNTDYLAGLAPVAKQMMQDLPFVQNFMPTFMLREYLFAEDDIFYTALSGGATGSTVVPGNPTSDIEQIMGWVANLRVANYQPNGIVLNPADVYKIFINKGQTSGDYTLPPGVTLSESGAIRIFGIPVYETTFIPEDKVLVGDWTKVGIVQTEGLSVMTDDKGDNFDNNTVTWKVEARVALAILQPAAFVFGDLGNVS